MRIQFITAIAAAALLAACSDEPATTTNPGGGGNVVPAPGVSGQVSGTRQEQFAREAGADRVYFGYDQYDLSAEARSVLERQAQVLRAHADWRLSIEGHADERGTREYNLALGERRANAVKDYLIALGVQQGRLTTVSYGKERPAVLGSNEAAWAQNRRGVSVVQ